MNLNYQKIVSLLKEQKWYVFAAASFLVALIMIFSLRDSPQKESQEVKSVAVEQTEEKITPVKERGKVSIRSVSTRNLTDEEKKLLEDKKESLSLKKLSASSKYARPKLEKYLIRIARQAGFPETEIEKLLRHSYAESGWNFFAVNNHRGEKYLGLLQVCNCHYKQYGHLVGATTRESFFDAMMDPEKNITVSKALWEADIRNPAFKKYGKWIRDGWGPWLATIHYRESESYRGTPWNRIITTYRYGIPVS